MQNKLESILITNIQRFSLHDGPGIRTTLFLKGCSIRCPWCCNPENIIAEPQSYTKDGVEEIYGKYYSPDELVQECLKDKQYYSGKLKDWNITKAEQMELLPGGVTFSGGEALLQMKLLKPVCERLHQQGVHITLETGLFCSSSQLESALQNIDLFYVDMKILNPELCFTMERGDITTYLSNLDTLLNWEMDGERKPVVIRIPVIGNYTDRDENRKLVRELLHFYKSRIIKVELLKEHSLGKKKYENLSMKMHYTGVNDELMEQYKTELSNLGIPVEICRI